MTQNIIHRMNRMATRAPISDMDKCTIFSIYPRDVTEKKITLFPYNYFIPKGSVKEPGRLVVGTGSWWRDVDPDQPLIEIPVSSIVVADSVVTDYCKGIYGYTVKQRSPGVFFIPGELTVTDLKSTKYVHRLKKAEEEQLAWYQYLCNAADALWARTNGNPLAIMDDMRFAAQELGYERDWMKSHIAVSLIRCINCGELRNPEYPTCKHCHTVVDRDLAKKLGIQVA